MRYNPLENTQAYTDVNQEQFVQILLKNLEKDTWDNTDWIDITQEDLYKIADAYFAGADPEDAIIIH